MKRLRDENGTEWMVYQVSRQCRTTGRRLAEVLPRTYAGGLLVFQSDTKKRRLAPFPGNWGDLPDATLRSFLIGPTPARPSGAVHSEEIELAFRDEERSRPIEK